MLNVVFSSRFKRDLRAAARRGHNFDLLDEIVLLLAEEKPLPERNRDHSLSGQYAGCRECHITPDWLLVYRVKRQELELLLMRTGSHSDIFS